MYKCADLERNMKRFKHTCQQCLSLSSGFMDEFVYFFVIVSYHLIFLYDYVVKGGMSGSYLYKNQNDAYQYIDGIYKKTISKDIVKRFKVENEPLLLMVSDYLMDNVGNKTSIRNIANSLTSNYYKTNDKTVGAYVDYLCKSFLFYPFTRYDIKGNKYLESDKKYYLSDL